MNITVQICYKTNHLCVFACLPNCLITARAGTLIHKQTKVGFKFTPIIALILLAASYSRKNRLSEEI